MAQGQGVGHMRMRKLVGDLARRSTLTLATTTGGGLPQATPLFFAAAPGGSLLFVSDARSRHGASIAANGEAAVAIYGETWRWNEIAGVQMEGSVRAILDGSERASALGTYRAKFPFVAEFTEQLARSNVYRFTPRWVRVIDNAVRFGYKEEFTIAEE